MVPHSPGAFYLFRGDCRQPPAKLARLRLYHFSIVPDRRALTSENVTFAFLSIISQSTIRSALCCGCGYIDLCIFISINLNSKFKWVQQIDDAFHFIHSTATQQLHVSTQSLSVYRSLPMQPHIFLKNFYFFSSCISTNISQHSLRHKPPFEPPHHRRLCFVVSLLFLFVLNASSTVCCVSPTLYSLLNESFFFSFRLHHSHHFIISQMRLCWSFFVCLFWFIFADEWARALRYRHTKKMNV